MNKRNKEFFEKQKEMELQHAWDMVSDHISKTSTGAWTHFVSTVETGHYGYVVMRDGFGGAKFISTKKYK